MKIKKVQLNLRIDENTVLALDKFIKDNHYMRFKKSYIVNWAIKEYLKNYSAEK